MSRNEGTAHGRHFTDEERTEDENRNHNQASGRRHFEANEDQKAGGHSDRWADSSDSEARGQQHEFRAGDDNDDDANRHSQEQSEGGMQGEGRNEGGRNQRNSR
jgi:hypothetical protein